MNIEIPVEPIICEDGWYPKCPNCGYYDLEETDITTRCPKCGQAIDWSWTKEFKRENINE